MFGLSETMAAGVAGLAGGVVLGLAAFRGRFCTLGAIEDALYASDFRRAQMWAAALAAAIASVFTLAHLNVVDLSQTVYARTAWDPLGAVVGGLAFGYGMAIAGNCGFGALARAGGGEIRSWVVVAVIGVSAYMTFAGPLAPLRLALFPVERLDPIAADPGIAGAAAALLGVAPLWIALAVALLFLALAIGPATSRPSAAQLAWGAAVGGAIALGWAATAHLSATGFEATPVESHTFTAPLGETILYLMTSSGDGLTFSVGSVAGVVLGAFAAARAQGLFRWEACDDAPELRRQIFGAFLMGVGGVIAVGCSIGQGLTAFSTLAWSAPLTAAAIVAGAAIGLRRLIEGPAGFRLFAAPRDR